MSDFLAEARVVIRPDTTKFRADLQAQLLAATRAVTVPVAITATGNFTTSGLAGLAVAQGAVNREMEKGAEKTKKKAEADKLAAKEAAAHAKTMGQLSTAAVASGAAMTGLRGAVLTAGGAFIAATVGIQAFGKAVQSAAQLESNLNVFRVTAGATADEMERVRDTAKALGRDLTLPGVTASDAAETFLTLSRAGLSVQDSLAGARGTLQLAVAAQISFADAAQLTASALNAFGLQGDAAVEVADTLTNAANASQASIGEMGIALRQSAAIADLAGFSFSETATFLTQLAQSGLAGSDAGTSFRVAIQRLIAPTGKARTALEGLNINLRDAAGNLRPEAFFELGEALERMSRAQADATRQLIFGNDASRAAAFFARLNAESFRQQERALNRAGAAAEVAGARNEGFAGSVENLKNQITALGIELGELAIPVLSASADTAALFFGALATQIGETREAFAGFGEDAEQLAEAFRQVSEDSGFNDFIEDVASGARLIESDIERATAAIGGLFGVGDEAAQAAPKVKRLTDEEKRLAEAIHDAVRPAAEQKTGLDELAAAAARAAGAVARLQGQQAGLEEQTTRARIAGDEDAELASLRERRLNLEAELAAQEAIIARPGTGGEATARQAIRQRILPQLEAVNSEIESILAEQQTRAEDLQRDRENAQEEQIRARDAADREFLDKLGRRRDDAGRRADAAAETEGIADDIRAQDRIQNLIKQQIEKVRDRVRDEKTRRAAIRELRIALIESRNEERALIQQQREDAIAQRAAGLELDIELADINENDARSVALRRKRIEQLRREVKLLHLQGNALKENRNERARLRKEIEEILEEEKDADKGRTAQQFFFEQLQAQQGFAANLLGNLITGPTAGLVGVPSPAADRANIPDLGGRATREVAAATGRAQIGPTAGQSNTEINILERIYQELRKLNGSYDSPEAIHQKKVGSGNMDNFAM